MIKYLIIDDEHIAHDIIKGYCDFLPHFELQKNCYDAFEAFEYLSTHHVDLIFLDLNMPKLKGFDFLKALNKAPKVIVTTAYSEFALEGYALNIVDYLLKPFSFERFLQAVGKATIDLKKELTPRTDVSDVQAAERIFIKGDKKLIQVDIAEILFLESAGNYTKVITTDKTITTREKISNLLTQLPAGQFLRVHKSFAVAHRHIRSIEGNRIKVRDHLIPIGKVYKMNLQDVLGWQ